MATLAFSVQHLLSCHFGGTCQLHLLRDLLAAHIRKRWHVGVSCLPLHVLKPIRPSLRRPEHPGKALHRLAISKW